MYYTTKNGKVRNSYLLSASRQKEMSAKGWMCRVPNSCRETEQELYDRLAAYYSDVRIYEDSTMVKGYHTIFAMCKY